MEPSEAAAQPPNALPFIPDIISRQADWPERKEVCGLSVQLTEAEMIEEAHKLTDNLSLADQIRSEAKAASDQFKARLEETQSAINRSRVLIDRGADTRAVECVWIWETAGTDESGSMIVDPDRRTLVRTDTWEAIRHERIPEEDRQLTMFDDEELTDKGGDE